MVKEIVCESGSGQRESQIMSPTVWLTEFKKTDCHPTLLFIGESAFAK